MRRDLPDWQLRTFRWNREVFSHVRVGVAQRAVETTPSYPYGRNINTGGIDFRLERATVWSRPVQPLAANGQFSFETASKGIEKRNGPALKIANAIRGYS